MNINDLAKLTTISPFELKDELIKIAHNSKNNTMLNAGRGNPNFLATVPRHGFFQLGQFALLEAERSFAYMPEGVGGFPLREGIEHRFETFCQNNSTVSGVDFMHGAVAYVRDQLGLSDGDFLYEMCEAILACNYPVPDRMLALSEKIVNQYIRQEMIDNNPHFKGDFDMYAVEGGTAAMTYLFNTLRENKLVSHGDSIAMGMPIFTPYMEIPDLDDYQLKKVYINADPELDWQYSNEELDKLLDPEIKVFCLVNPSNPPSVKLCEANMKHLVEIIKQRPDLIIITDDVYATFADNYTSIFAYCPANTILVYSYSKYFGATGWRLGVIATHHSNVIDNILIKNLSAAQRDSLNKRYSSIMTNPADLKFIDRLVADSRTVALNHTAGLSTPQQVQMVLFSLFSLMDQPDAYKNAMKRLIRSRRAALYRAMNVQPKTDENLVGYYELIDLDILGKNECGVEFVDWMRKNMKPFEILFYLAEKSGVVLLPGKGFGAQHRSARVSLANLNEYAYVKIGKAIRELMDSYYEKFNALTK